MRQRSEQLTNNNAGLELRFRHSTDARRSGVVHVLLFTSVAKVSHKSQPLKATKARREGRAESAKLTLDWIHLAQHSFS